MHRPHHIRMNGVVICCPGDPKVCNFHLSLCGNNNILGFDISVDNIFGMSRLYASRYLDGNTQCLFKGQLAFLFDIFFQCKDVYKRQYIRYPASTIDSSRRFMMIWISSFQWIFFTMIVRIPVQMCIRDRYNG